MQKLEIQKCRCGNIIPFVKFLSRNGKDIICITCQDKEFRKTQNK